jgi:hypothetical protein
MCASSNPFTASSRSCCSRYSCFEVNAPLSRMMGLDFIIRMKGARLARSSLVKGSVIGTTATYVAECDVSVQGKLDTGNS